MQFTSRRDVLRSAACGFGGIALAGLTSQQVLAQKTHFPAKAKRVIFLFMHGGVSQMDSFDRKPVLNEQHGNPLPFNLPDAWRRAIIRQFVPARQVSSDAGSAREVFQQTASDSELE